MLSRAPHKRTRDPELATRNGKSKSFDLGQMISGVFHFESPFGAGTACFVDASSIGICCGVSILTTCHALRNHTAGEGELSIAELARRAATVKGTWHNDEYDPYQFSLAPHLGCVGFEGLLDYFVCALDDATCAQLLRRRVRHFDMTSKRHIGSKGDIVLLCGYDGGKGSVKASCNHIVDLEDDDIVFKGDTSVGFSGGPVVNDGELIGLFKSRDRQSDLQWATQIKTIFHDAKARDVHYFDDLGGRHQGQ